MRERQRVDVVVVEEEGKKLEVVYFARLTQVGQIHRTSQVKTSFFSLST